MGVDEIKEAVKSLSREDLGAFRKWFWEFDQEALDKEIEEDVAAGRFDSILREVDKDIHLDSWCPDSIFFECIQRRFRFWAN